MRHFFLLAFLLPLEAHALTLESPIDCKVGTDCFIQNYVDADPSAAWKDYACGPLSYEKHTGTDIRLRTLAAMERGVKVVAAAPGVVRGVRDGEEDRLLSDRRDARVAGRECGNGVVITTEEGYETQYCHMKKGSIAVKKDDRVATGQMLGLVGLSGSTQFPHVHFEVRKGKEVLDPFTGGKNSCGGENHPLWSSKALAALPYVSTGVLSAGFSDNASALSQGDANPTHTTLSASAPALIFWVQAFGLRAGDTLKMQLQAPDGSMLAQTSHVFEKNKATFFQFIGKKRKSTQWQAGAYKGTYSILRSENGAIKSVAGITQTVQVQ